MKKILVPTDFSGLSKYAFDLAKRIAVRTGAELHTLKVVEAPAQALFNEKGELIDNDDLDTAPLKLEAKEAEEKIARWPKEGEKNLKSVVKIGHLKEDLLKYIEEEGIDLVVMGTHGATGIKELLPGTITERIVRSAKAPILSLKCDRSDTDLNEILLAGDFDKPEKENLSVLKELQRAFEATIHLLRIVAPKAFQTSKKLEQNMKNFAFANKLENVQFHVRCDESVEKGILHFLEEKGMDLVVIGTQGRSRLAQFFKGSISKNIINHIFSPILTYRF